MKRMIVVNTKGVRRPQTNEVSSCVYNHSTKRWDVTYKNGKTYPYGYNNVEKLSVKRNKTPKGYRFYCGSRQIDNISNIYEFVGHNGDVYYRFEHDKGPFEEYAAAELQIEKGKSKSTKCNNNVFSYLKEIASINNLRNDSGEKLLEKNYSQIDFISEQTALASYLEGHNSSVRKHKTDLLIFPFGCNKSQYKAVSNAMTNKISVIQGPPGTGKTQTILNIIANLLINGQTVQVVSNNNTAIENIVEKLNSYDLEFIAALLGSYKNKEDFIVQQSGTYPDFSDWAIEENAQRINTQIGKLSDRTKAFFEASEKEAILRQELSTIDVEYNHFRGLLDSNNRMLPLFRIKNSLRAVDILKLMRELQEVGEADKEPGLLLKLKLRFKYGIVADEIRGEDLGEITDKLQDVYYIRRKAEIEKQLYDLNKIVETNSGIVEELKAYSMRYFKNHLIGRYSGKFRRRVFSNEDLWKNAKLFIDEYPVVLSTTFSSKNTLGSRFLPVIYDYVIMDESSQVDIATGALALYSARNAVIVGDSMQLPNVITDTDRLKSESIYKRYNIPEGYGFTHSFLDSVLCVVKDVPDVLLREHYRCHPKIIGFCNQKFYKGQLIIMTKDAGEENVINAIITTKGNHARGHYNQRQIDVIKEEILKGIDVDYNDIGIISPYREQVSELQKAFPDRISIDTVHKFQGREKNTIIISTVDNVTNDFSDNPNLINVAVSRAKNRLYIVSSGNEKAGNIYDLIEYIKYNNCEVRESKVNSIFDYLYTQYSEELRRYLKGKRRISEYNSENLMYSLLNEIFEEQGWNELEVLCHISLRNIIKDNSILNREEQWYAMNPLTHIDFSIVNRVTKQYILAIEVDGYAFHKGKNKDAQKQAKRDVMKDQIFEKYGLNMLRFTTNASAEKEIIIRKLKELMTNGTV